MVARCDRAARKVSVEGGWGCAVTNAWHVLSVDVGRVACVVSVWERSVQYLPPTGVPMPEILLYENQCHQGCLPV